MNILEVKYGSWPLAADAEAQLQKYVAKGGEHISELSATWQRGLDAVAPRALEHPDRELAREVESVRTMLARVREELGETDAAARVIEEKLRASELTSIDDAIDLAHLAELRASQGRFDTAQDLMRRAIRISESKCEPTEPRRGRWVAALARINESAGRKDEALAGFRRALELLLKAHPPPTPEELHELEAAIIRNAALVRDSSGDLGLNLLSRWCAAGK